MPKTLTNLAISLASAIYTVNAAIPGPVQFKPMFGTEGANRLVKPVWIGEVPGQKDVFLVAEQGHAAVNDSAHAWILENKDGVYVKSKFLSLRVPVDNNEAGFLGIAFHPKFSENRKYYVNWTPVPSGFWADSTFIDERTTDPTFRKDSGEPPKRILSIFQPYWNHKGGTLQFGPDGYLYIGMGDGGNRGDPENRAQNKTSLLGKMLRIDVDNPSNGLPYGIPQDNPFVSETNSRKEIWALGLRNPWKFSFDKLTGEMWIGDVGQGTMEEINIGKKGANYGWNMWEGTGCFLTGCQTSLSSAEPPVVGIGRDSAYDIIGGVVYRGRATSPFYGAFFFGDHELRNVWALTQSNGKLTERKFIGKSPAQLSSFGMTADNTVLLVGYNNGIIYKLEHPELTETTTKVDQPKKPAKLRSGFLRKSGQRYFPASPEDGDAWTSFLISAPDGTQINILSAESLASGFRVPKPGIYVVAATSRKGTLRGSFLLD